MILQLGRLGRGRLGVIARTSSMSFKGGTRRAREIGEALRADYLLEGSVRREGDRVRITASLVETSSEIHLWTDVYDRHLTDCLSVQADVAARIAGSLAVELLPDRAPSPSTGTRHVEAYQSYLKGRYHWNRPGDEGIRECLAFYGQALKLDPGFATAHGAMARATVAAADYYLREPREALDAAEVSAARALAINPTEPEALVAIAEVRRCRDWDWDGAEEAYQRALSFNPSNEAARRLYGLLLGARCRPDAATAMTDRAVELDPLCLVDEHERRLDPLHLRPLRRCDRAVPAHDRHGPGLPRTPPSPRRRPVAGWRRRRQYQYFDSVPGALTIHIARGARPRIGRQRRSRPRREHPVSSGRAGSGPLRSSYRPRARARRPRGSRRDVQAARARLR